MKSHKWSKGNWRYWTFKTPHATIDGSRFKAWNARPCYYVTLSLPNGTKFYGEGRSFGEAIAEIRIRIAQHRKTTLDLEFIR